ncbi:MAG: hypothetical protein KDA29_13250 [Phycisphaerales bacterium]|jgi:hypothetical protein|nr:hypothetical protein [Phycisphaerales bacterium]
MNEQPARPEDRFAGDFGVIGLEAMTAELISRAVDSKHGHAQQTLYKHGHTTVAIFGFGAGSGLPQHAAKGVVTVQVLIGEVTLETPDGANRLVAGQLARLAPGVEHAVQTEREAAILVHVALDPHGT